ncbi:GumC family protein [Mesorhizobium sp. Root1471]|nr:GumC family protein [Mesorhizobium sp. Root1471]KQZ15510.1 hypothetical protein ASD27_16695 [Mesorhizobium sp. Root1471]
MNIDIFQLPGILKRRAGYVILTTLLCVALAFAFLLVQKPYYRSSAQILVDLDRPPVIGAESNAGIGQQASAQTVGSQIYVLQSRDLLREVVKKLDLTKDSYLAGGGGLRQMIFGRAPQAEGDRTDAVVDALLKNLTIARADDSLVFSVTVKHRDSDAAAKIANTIAELYIDTSSTSKSDADTKASMALQVQTEELRKRLIAALAEAERFRAENGLVSTGQQGLVGDQQLAGLSQQLLAAKQVADQQKTISEQANQLNLSDVETGAIAEALQSTGLTSLRARYAQLLDQQAQLSTTLGEGHPQMRAIRSQVASMRTTIEKELGRIRKSAANNYERAKANVAALQNRFDETSESNSDKGKAKIRLAQLESEAASINTVYQSFLTRAEQLGRQQDINSSNSRVISAAVPSSTPVQAPKALVLAASLLFGLALGSVVAVARDLLSGGAPAATVVQTPAQRPAEAPAARDSAGFAHNVRQMFKLKRSRASETGKLADLPLELSLGRTMELLRSRREAGSATAVAVLNATPGYAGYLAAADIASSLHRAGEDVFFSDGTLRLETIQSLTGRQPVGFLDKVAPLTRYGLNPLTELLEFTRLGEKPRPAKTLLALVPEAAPQNNQPFLVVDAWGTEAEEILPIVLKYADSILILSQGKADPTTLNMLMAEIEPWREKLVGTLVAARKAA